MSDIIAQAKEVFDYEIKSLELTRESLGESFIKIFECILQCKGKVILTGMGKPGHIGRKVAATFSSLGTPSFFLHPAEARHGDLGMVSENDVVIAISLSGESEEVIGLIPNLKFIGSKIIALTNNADSTLAKAADIVQVLPKFDEACHLGLAPTSSTTVELAYCDALAVTLSRYHNFTKSDFAMFHPAGSLGKKLIIKVKDIMLAGDESAVIPDTAGVIDAIVAMSSKAIGLVTVVDSQNKIAGIMTDGDLRRLLSKGTNIYEKKVCDVMNAAPTKINENILAVDALNIMKNKSISAMPVIDDEGFVSGSISVNHIISAGILV